MRNLLKVLALFLSIVLSFSIFGCKKGGGSLHLNYFNTYVNVYTSDFAPTEQTVSKLNELFSSVEKELSISKENSFTQKFNALKKGQSLSVSPLTLKILNKAQEYYLLTNKKFNPAVYPLSELWHFANGYPTAQFTPPTANQTSQIVNSGILDFSSITINQTDSTLTKQHDETKIDLGGIAKGYVSDIASKILTDAGHTSGYVDIGGSSINILSATTLGIKHPRATENLSKIIDVNILGKTNLSVSTSGDYMKYYDYENTRYSHLIDPSIGAPSNTGITSATVITNDGTFADAFTTALCLCKYSENDQNELYTLINKILSVDSSAMIFIIYEHQENKLIITNQSQGENFTLLDTSYTIMQI